MLASPGRFLLDNSTSVETREGYDRLCELFGFTALRQGNLGITGGRVFCARHFDTLPQYDALYWFEDDMLLHAPDAPLCRNGFRAHVAGLDQAIKLIVRREHLDYLKLSFTQFFGDHHLNWAWYHVRRDLRERSFPDGTFRTRILHSGAEGGVSYIVGDVHFDNWPTYITRRGNALLFLTNDVPAAWEGCYMARAFELQQRGELRGARCWHRPSIITAPITIPRKNAASFSLSPYWMPFGPALKTPPTLATFDQRWTAWGAAYGGSGTANGDPVIGSTNVSAHVAGFAGGLDYHVTPDTVWASCGLDQGQKSSHHRGPAAAEQDLEGAALNRAALSGEPEVSHEDEVCSPGVWGNQFI